MKTNALLSFKDNTFSIFEEINIDKFYIDDELKLVNATIEVHDPRYISRQQQKLIHAIIYDIAIYSEGYCDEVSKTYWKNYFKQVLIDNELLDRHISLANCEMTEANLLIDFILEFTFKNNISLRYETVKDYDDLERWQYMSIKYRKCCICGLKAEIEHYETIGMGNNRKTLDDSNHLKMALCRSHHIEIHSMPKEKFCTKYHVKPIRLNESQVKELKL